LRACSVFKEPVAFSAVKRRHSSYHTATPKGSGSVWKTFTWQPSLEGLHRLILLDGSAADIRTARPRAPDWRCGRCGEAVAAATSSTIPRLGREINRVKSGKPHIPGKPHSHRPSSIKIAYAALTLPVNRTGRRTATSRIFKATQSPFRTHSEFIHSPSAARPTPFPIFPCRAGTHPAPVQSPSRPSPRLPRPCAVQPPYGPQGYARVHLGGRAHSTLQVRSA
ncbi:hypothetical protein SAMN05421543_1181, partial [Alicyclobacillus macrosporangiidus]